MATFFGDILSEAAEHRIEISRNATVITDNDACYTLVAADPAPQSGREQVCQVMREKSGFTPPPVARVAGPAQSGR